MSTLKEKFNIIKKYLSENPQNFSSRSKTMKEAFAKEGIEHIEKELFEKFEKSRKPKKPSMPQTIPDEAVSLIINIYYNRKKTELEKIKILHQESMSSENIIGDLLERYLASILEKHDWVWCSGEFVKSIDFIKKTDDGWVELQIKNRDNTENSSSSKVRDGTKIIKWFRCFSKKSELNWSSFPDSEMKLLLSEEAFNQFIISYLKSVK